MTLSPKGKKVHTQSEQRRRGGQARAERKARQAAHLAAKADNNTSPKQMKSKEGSNAEDEK